VNGEGRSAEPLYSQVCGYGEGFRWLRWLGLVKFYLPWPTVRIDFYEDELHVHPRGPAGQVWARWVPVERLRVSASGVYSFGRVPPVVLTLEARGWPQMYVRVPARCDQELTGAFERVGVRVRDVSEAAAA
jgi:hypothetical protein